jgi:hypothetical protein
LLLYGRFSEPQRRSLSFGGLGYCRWLTDSFRSFANKSKDLFAFAATGGGFFVERIILGVEIGRGPVPPDETTGFLEFCGLLPICILSIDLTLNALFCFRPVFNGLMKLLISTFFLQKAILMLKPVTLYFLFLQIGRRKVVVVI